MKGKMDFDNVKKIYESGKKKPKKTLCILVLLFVLVGIIAFVTSFCGEKGKQFAEPSKISNDTVTTPKAKQKQITNNDRTKDNLKIEQHTEGNQSPAIVSNSDVKIEYGGNK